MRLLKSPLQLTKKTTQKFTLDRSTWYLISVTAQVKSEKQRHNNATDDEDIRIEIDNRKFPKLYNQKRYLDSPAAFSGGKLHNQLKSVYFFIYLKSGKHQITFIPDEGGKILDVELNELKDFPNANLQLEKQIQKTERRPWMTFVLVGPGLKSFTIDATTEWHLFDGDDLKIIVDGKTKINQLSIKHRKWIFAANIINKISNHERAQKTFQEGLKPNSLHYIELWADQSPTLHSIQFQLVEPSLPISEVKIQKYQDQIFGRSYNQLDADIANAVDFWNSFFLQQEYPPEELLDPSLVKAIVYRESKLGYWPNKNIIDVMQVWDEKNDAKSTLLGETPENEFITPDKEGHIHNHYPTGVEPEVKSRTDSIFWGVRWLYHKAQYLPNLNKPYRREWRSWEEAVRKYNANPKLVVEYLEEVFLIYEKGIDLKGSVLWKK